MSLTAALMLLTATPFADLAAIDRDVATFTGASIGMPGGARGPVDRRLRLNACRTPLSFAWRTAQRDTVVVQCPDAGGWRLYVPVLGAAAEAAALPAINRGDAVTISVAGDGFAVSQPGEALESGPVGAWIRVRTVSAARNTATANAMRGQVMRPGLVVLPLP